MKQTLSRNPPLPFPWLQDAAGHYPTAPLPPDICRNLYLTLNFLSRRTLSFLQFLYPDILPASLAPYPLWSSALFARFHSGSPGSFFFLSVWLFLCQPIQDQLVPFLVLKVYSFSVLTEHRGEHSHSMYRFCCWIPPGPQPSKRVAAQEVLLCTG